MMLNGLVTVTQAGLIFLLGMLGFRMFALIRQESPLTIGAMAAEDKPCIVVAPGSDPGPASKNKRRSTHSTRDRTELFTFLHILAGLQERDCRVKGLVLLGAPETLRICAAAWLYGAACAVTPRSQRHTESLLGIVAKIVSHKTGSRQSEVVQAISTLTASNLLLACYRAGLEGAEFWQIHQYVPASSSLYDVVTRNAFI